MDPAATLVLSSPVLGPSGDVNLQTVFLSCQVSSSIGRVVDKIKDTSLPTKVVLIFLLERSKHTMHSPNI
jgi:hypothetical protein